MTSALTPYAWALPGFLGGVAATLFAMAVIEFRNAIRWRRHAERLGALNARIDAALAADGGANG